MAKGYFRNWESYRCLKCGYSVYVKDSKKTDVCPECNIKMDVIT